MLGLIYIYFFPSQQNELPGRRNRAGSQPPENYRPRPDSTSYDDPPFPFQRNRSESVKNQSLEIVRLLRVSPSSFKKCPFCFCFKSKSFLFRKQKKTISQRKSCKYPSSCAVRMIPSFGSKKIGKTWWTLSPLWLPITVTNERKTMSAPFPDKKPETLWEPTKETFGQQSRNAWNKGKRRQVFLLAKNQGLTILSIYTCFPPRTTVC